MKEFFSAIFNFLFFIIVVGGGLALWSYNSLQRLAQGVKEAASNIQVAISRKVSLINQLIDIVKNQQEGEQFVHLKIAQDASASTLTTAYESSGSVLAAVQAYAERYPNLKVSEQYGRLMDSIHQCESDIQGQRQGYNATVREYNTRCLSIPTVFIARMMGFPSAPYLQFDVSGAQDPNTLKQFATDDGQRLQNLLGEAGTKIVGATKALSFQANQAMQTVSNKISDRKAVQYFYMEQGSVPQGPATLEVIQNKVTAQEVSEFVKLAEQGTSLWLTLGEVQDAHTALVGAKT